MNSQPIQPNHDEELDVTEPSVDFPVSFNNEADFISSFVENRDFFERLFAASPSKFVEFIKLAIEKNVIIPFAGQGFSATVLKLSFEGMSVDYSFHSNGALTVIQRKNDDVAATLITDSVLSIDTFASVHLRRMLRNNYSMQIISNSQV